MSRWHLCVAVAVAAAGVAQAQRPGGGMRQQTPLAVLALTNEDLQKELKITDDQKKSLKEVMDKAADLTKKQADARSGGQPDREKMQELQKEGEALAKDATAATDKAFTDDQKKRVKQIDVQRQGVRALSNADVQTGLKVTDEQKTKLKTVTDEYSKASTDLRTEYGIGGMNRPDADKRAEYDKKAKALSDETLEKVKKELTDEQQKAWKEMVGEPFDVSKLQPQRRREN